MDDWARIEEQARHTNDPAWWAEQETAKAQQIADRKFLAVQPKGIPAGLPALHEVNPQQLQAVDLRLEGKPYKEIAELCGYATPQAAFAAVKGYYQRYGQDRKPSEVRAEAQAQLDSAAAMATRIMIAYEAKDADVSLRAMGQLVRIKEREAKMFGADKPMQVNVIEYTRRLAIQKGYTPEEAMQIAILAQAHAEGMIQQNGLPELPSPDDDA